MRCSICLEEMAHPTIGVFACPNKYEGWHTREYRKLALAINMLEDKHDVAMRPEKQPELDKLIQIRESLKREMA